MKSNLRWLTPLLLLTSSWAWAKTAVLPVHTVNLSEGEAAAIAQVLADTYANVSGEETVILPRSEETQLSVLATGAGADAVLQTTAVGLGIHSAQGARVLVQVVLRNTAGDELYRADLTASSAQDMPTVARRLAVSLHEKRPVTQTRTPQTVTQAESERRNRRYTEKVMGFKTGVGPAVGIGDNELTTLASFGFDGRLESESYFLEFGGYILLPASSTQGGGYGGLGSEIGASWYLGDGNISPYLGGGVLPRLIFSSSSLVNFAPYVQGGLMFARDSSTRFFTDVRIAQNVVPIETYEGWYHSDSSLPTELSFNVGIGW